MGEMTDEGTHYYGDDCDPPHVCPTCENKGEECPTCGGYPSVTEEP